jgi:glycosyltransferase involved in cell wall biosynthesis
LIPGQQTRVTKGRAVCIIVENLPVPLDRRVWKEARTLTEAGYSVSVICPKGKGAYQKSYEFLDGIHIHRHFFWEASGAVGYILEYATAFAAELYLMMKVYGQTRFQILQGCNPPDSIFLLALLMRPFGVRYVFDQHDLCPELFEAKFGRRFRFLSVFTRLAEKLSFKTSAVCIATNESFKEIAIARGGKREDRVFVLRNCPDVDDFPPVPNRTRSGEKLKVVYVGFMGNQDGLDLLIEAIEHLVKRKERSNTSFVLVGGGTMLNELRAMVQRKDLESFVSFTGKVSHDEVIRQLSDSDVGVAPDPKTPMNDNSTMIKIFEYMAASLPIVQFDLKEGRRMAGPASLYAQPNDPLEFAAQLDRLLENRQLREELGSIGRKRVEEKLNWNIEKKSLLEAYQAAMQS